MKQNKILIAAFFIAIGFSQTASLLAMDNYDPDNIKNKVEFFSQKRQKEGTINMDANIFCKEAINTFCKENEKEYHRLLDERRRQDELARQWNELQQSQQITNGNPYDTSSNNQQYLPYPSLQDYGYGTNDNSENSQQNNTSFSNQDFSTSDMDLMNEFYCENNFINYRPFTLEHDIVDYCNEFKFTFERWKNDKKNSNNSSSGSTTSNNNNQIRDNGSNPIDPKIKNNGEQDNNNNRTSAKDEHKNPTPSNSHMGTTTKIVAIVGVVAAVSGISYVAYNARYYWNKFFGQPHNNNE